VLDAVVDAVVDDDENTYPITNEGIRVAGLNLTILARAAFGDG
jgi:hypothetical protein